jgi:hypothetical protein
VGQLHGHHPETDAGSRPFTRCSLLTGPLPGTRCIATEVEDGVKISAYVAQVRDPLLREAIALQGSEELRHAALLSTLITRYDVRVLERPPAQLPVDLEGAFVDIGYGECIDSFFAFGLFAVARQSGFFPKPLLDAVEPILDEEARHIVFFVNREAYQRPRRGNGFAPLRATRALHYYGRALRRRLGAFRRSNGVGFTRSGSSRITADLTPRTLLQICLRENDRRLAGFDSDLLRPRFVPVLAGLAWRSLGIVSRGAQKPCAMMS